MCRLLESPMSPSWHILGEPAHSRRQTESQPDALRQDGGPLLSVRFVTYYRDRDRRGRQSYSLVSADNDSARARYGWQSDFPTFADEEPCVVRISLQQFLADAGESQIRAWDDSIPRIQVEVGAVVEIDELADQYTAILEYELPLESRRPDVVLLVSGATRAATHTRGWRC